MRVTIKSIGSVKRLAAILTAATLFLMSCVREDAALKVKLYPVVSSNVETVIETRALSSDYKTYEVEGTNIKAYALAFNKIFTTTREPDGDSEGVFTYSSSGWSSTLEVTNDLRYSIYAYSPAPFPVAMNMGPSSASSSGIYPVGIHAGVSVWLSRQMSALFLTVAALPPPNT
jgi:hypothetical protein